jgi:hypothetical protein
VTQSLIGIGKSKEFFRDNLISHVSVERDDPGKFLFFHSIP